MQIFRPLLFLMIAAITLQSCSILRPGSSIENPEIHYTSFRVVDLGMDGATIIFEFDVTNPNRQTISAKGYEYELDVADKNLLSGSSTDALIIEGKMTSQIQIPVRFSYRQLTSTMNSIVSKDSISYELKSVVEFDIPILGKRKVPVVASGMVPNIQLPGIRFAGYEINRMSFNGAEIVVSFSINNPNDFGFTMNSLRYAIELLGEEVVDTTLGENLRIEARANEIVSFTLLLDAATVGRSAMRILLGNSAISYRIIANGDISADIPNLRGSVDVPFEQAGEFKLN